MKFAIQHNLINDDSLMQIHLATDGLPRVYVGVIPFSDEITAEEDVDLTATDFIPYGSTSLTNLSHARGWKGCHFDLDVFDYEVFANNRGDMLNAEHIMTVPEAIAFLQKQPDCNLWFTRPVKDLKHYSGQVMESKEMWEWFTDALECAMSGTYQMNDTMKVVLAEPKVLQAEWRYFVIDGQVIDGSMYRYRGNFFKSRETDLGVLKEAQKLADKWLPNDCVCMDLALVDDELKVIEFNCINSSGFYDNNIDSIFKAWYNYHTK